MTPQNPAGIFPLMQRQGIYVHAYLIDTGRLEDGLILIDTLYATDAKTIFEAIAAIGRMPQDVKHILLTHAHRAHLGGLVAIQKASNAKVHCHAWEVDIVEGDRHIQNTTLRPQYPLQVWPFQVASRFSSFPACKVDALLNDGDLVGPIRAVYTPGHTPGHLAFYWPERNALFAGDALVTWPAFGEGWGGFMLNHRQNRASVRRMAELQPDWIGAGHGDPITDGAAHLRKLVDEMPKD